MDFDKCDPKYLLSMYYIFKSQELIKWHQAVQKTGFDFKL